MENTQTMQKPSLSYFLDRISQDLADMGDTLGLLVTHASGSAEREEIVANVRQGLQRTCQSLHMLSDHCNGHTPSEH